VIAERQFSHKTVDIFPNLNLIEKYNIFLTPTCMHKNFLEKWY